MKREPAVLYLDAKSSFLAALNIEEEGNKAIILLEKIQQGEEKPITSALTLSFWELKKEQRNRKALETAEARFNFPNIEITSVDRI